MMARILPLVAFVLMGILLAIGLQNSDEKSLIPSPLIGKPVPYFSLPMLNEPGTRVDPQALEGKPYLINFWASWCVTCVVEHPHIMALAESGVLPVVGLNFRDEPEDARAWLARHGDPYALIITDYDGRVSIDFGVYAAPESFLVDPDGRVVFKQIGALTPEIIREVILPMLDSMQQEPS